MATRRCLLQYLSLFSVAALGCQNNSTHDAPPLLSVFGAADAAAGDAAPSDAAPSTASRIWPTGGSGVFPARLRYETETGTITTVNTAGPIETSGHPFFTPLGQNGRACITCHQPADGMSLSAKTASERWDAAGAKDPLFAAVDGSNCPNLPQDDRASHSLLIEHGLFRITRPWPPVASDGSPIEPEFTLEVVRDPTGCNLDSRYGLASDKPVVSVFRRPRPAANLNFATAIGFAFDPKNGLPLVIDPESGQPTSGNILADVRVRTLPAQAIDALISHGEAVGTAIDRAAINGIVDFETRLFTAQSFDTRAGDLAGDGALGGPDNLAVAPAGQLQSSTANPIWGEFTPWKDLPAPANGETDPTREFRLSVARGAKIFASRQFLVTDTAGINDTGFGNPVRNSCAFCHNMLHAGLDVAPGQVDLGTTNSPHANPQPELPMFRLTCNTTRAPQPYLGRVVYTHDPGYALTTGKCIDIGKITAQSMRGIAARAPYFSNGSAKTLADVIEFYDRRYELELTDEEKLDLLHLLEVL
jgi:hypothetical protein